jgi:hypothetical protein
MRFARSCLVLSVVVVLSGCSGLQQSRTADELRTKVNNHASFTSRDVFEVKKPYRQVADTLRKKWLECLDSSGTSAIHRGGNSFGSATNTYTPKASVSEKRTELSLQHKVSGTGVKQLGGPPPEGFFIFVTDVTPVDRGTSRIDVQKHMPGYEAVIKAVHGWAEGGSMACPDLAQ